MSRLQRFASTCAALAIGALLACAPAPPPRPHVVLLIADDLGWNDVGFHGSEIGTPNLDALAREGVVLDRFYVLPACTSTRGALLTGRYPIRYGLQASSVQPHATFGLDAAERTLPEALREAGYRTALVGKWHLGHARPELLPLARGFDHHYGHYNDQIGYFTHLRNGGLDWQRNGEVVREEGYATTLLGAEAARIVRAHDPATPLFLQVAFLAAHTPLEVPPDYLAGYADVERRGRRTFAAMVTAMDDAVGEIAAALEEAGMADDTLLLFTSDNGANESFGGDNGPLRGGKYRVYEGGVRVPAFVRWPAALEGGRHYAHPLHVVDLYPTLVELAGGSLDQALPLDGVDVAPALTRDEPLPPRDLLVNASPAMAALRSGDWKLVVKHGPRRRRGGEPTVELFDLARDPGETRDLAAERPEVAARLRAVLQRYEDAAVPPLKPGPVPKDFRAPAVWGAF
ncbi:MAG: arylsulfatase B [Myxococcota bacterium]